MKVKNYITTIYLTVKPSRIEKVSHEWLRHVIQGGQHYFVDNTVHGGPLGRKNLLALARQYSQYCEELQQKIFERFPFRQFRPQSVVVALVQQFQHAQ